MSTGLIRANLDARFSTSQYSQRISEQGGFYSIKEGGVHMDFTLDT